MLPIYDYGDPLHPGDLGYRTMGGAIDLSLFDERPRVAPAARPGAEPAG